MDALVGAGALFGARVRLQVQRRALRASASWRRCRCGRRRLTLVVTSSPVGRLRRARSGAARGVLGRRSARRSLPGDDRLQPAVFGRDLRGPVDMVCVSRDVSDRARAGRCAVDRRRRWAALRPARLPASRMRERLVAAACVWVARRRALDRGQRQPEPAAVLRAGRPALALAAGWGACRDWRWRAGPADDRPHRGSWRPGRLCRRVAREPVPEARSAADVLRRRYLLGRRPPRAPGALRRHARRSTSTRRSTTSSSARSCARARSRRYACYVFGFSARRTSTRTARSASRFFWSRPVIVDFNDGTTRATASTGLLADLDQRRPAVVALQQQRLGARRAGFRGVLPVAAARSPAGCAPNYVPATVRRLRRLVRRTGSS